MFQEPLTINGISIENASALVIGVVIFSIWFCGIMNRREKEFENDDSQSQWQPQARHIRLPKHSVNIKLYHH